MDYTDHATRLRIEEGVKEDIDRHAASTRERRFPTRLSPSWLGEECLAAGWYNWHWVSEPETVEGRMARYNKRGEENENNVTAWLRETGWTVREKDERGEQIAVQGLGGHLYGKIDGEGSHPDYTAGQFILLEYKYINTKRFVALTNKALQLSDPKYYSQVCLYMYFRDLPATMFIPFNRNDEDFKPVIIPRDDTQVAVMLEKAHTIATAQTRPPRIAESPAFFGCKFCNHKEVCHNGAKPIKNCRSCVNSYAVENGKFACKLYNQVIPNKNAIMAGCDHWTPVG